MLHPLALTGNRNAIRRLAAVLTALAGVMNIVSALYPAVPRRMDILTDLLPLVVIRSAQSGTVLLGFALVLLADGLRKRRRRALQITVLLLIVSALFHVTKGLDFEEATAAIALAALLVRHRSVFSVPSGLFFPARPLSQVSVMSLLYACYVVGGFVILRHAVFPRPTLVGVLAEPVRLVGDSPYYQYLTPQARWFERSITMIGSIVALFLVLRVLRPLIPSQRATAADRRQARELVRKHATDTLAYFSLQDRRLYFFNEARTAFLSYRLWGTVALVGGDPIGPEECASDLIASFIEFALANGLEPCFLGVSARTVSRYSALGMGTLKIGEEAVIDLASFDVDTLKRKVRRAARHISDLGITAVTYRRDELPAPVLAQIRSISREWVRSNGGVERGFSMTLGRLPREADGDCELVVAQRGEEVLGFLSLAPVYRAGAWSLDSMRRRPDSPNGLMEFLIIRAAETYCARGCAMLSLNFATLSNAAGDIDSRAVDQTRRFLFERLSSYYQLKSLYQFNVKFAPQWSSRYLAYRDVLKIPKLALAITQSEDPIRLPLLSGGPKRHA